MILINAATVLKSLTEKLVLLFITWFIVKTNKQSYWKN